MYAYKIKPKPQYQQTHDDVIASIKRRSQTYLPLQGFKDLYLKFAELKLPEFIQSLHESKNDASQALPWRAVIEEILAIPGYNKTRLATEIGVSRRTIKRWLDGETAHPHNRSFARLFRVFCKVYCQYVKVAQTKIDKVE